MNRTQNLNPDHLAMLHEGSAISDEVILARGYRTVDNPAELAELGFGPSQRRRGLLPQPAPLRDGKAKHADRCDFRIGGGGSS